MELDKDSSLYGPGAMLMGAIFMSNRTTKRECFKRQLFGLPGSQTGFVKKVKTGMILFLFEYEERKLHGVFEATSDGALNIVPHAFISSGQPFPAQIRFKRIWSCYPLSEHEFYDAIKENYYMHHKFNFCLSKQQVSDLISLFYSRKINTQQHQRSGRGRTVIPDFEKPDFCRVSFENLDQDGHNRDDDKDSSGYPALYGRNLSNSMHYKNNCLNTEGSMVGVEPVSHPTVSHAAESQNPDFVCSTSQSDRAFMDKVIVSPSKDCPYSPRVLGFRHESCSITLRDTSLVASKHSAHSRDYADSQAPLSGNQLYQETSDLPFTNYQSVGISTSPDAFKGASFPGYEPPSSNSPLLLSKDFKKGLNVTNLQDYQHSSFPDFCEPSTYMIPFSNVVHSLGRSQVLTHVHPSAPQCQDNSRGPRYWHHGCESLPPPEDEHFDKKVTHSSFLCSPDRYTSESKDDDGNFQNQDNSRGPRYWHHGCDYFSPPEDEPFDKITESSFLGSSHKGQSKIQYRHTSDSKDGDGSERSRPYHSTERDEHYPNVMNFRSETYQKRTSVFSRLSKVPKVCAEEDENYESDKDLSADQLMELLSKREHHWSKVKVTKPTVTQGDDEQLKSDFLLEPGGAATLDEEEGFYCSEEVTEETKIVPFLNFKRRSGVRKMSSDTETRHSVESKDCERSSGKNKRRKLVRPSFIGVSSRICKSECQNVQTAAQGLFVGQAVVSNGKGKEGFECEHVPVRKNEDEGDRSYNYNMEGASQEPLVVHTFPMASECIRNVNLSTEPCSGQVEETVANNGVNLISGKVDSECQNVQGVSEQIFGGQLLVINGEGRGGGKIGDASVTSVKGEGDKNLDKTVIEKIADEQEGLKYCKVNSYNIERVSKGLGMVHTAVTRAEDMETVELPWKALVGQAEEMAVNCEGQGSATRAFSGLDINHSHSSIGNLGGGRKELSHGSSETSTSPVALECDGNNSTVVGQENVILSSGNGESSCLESEIYSAEPSVVDIEDEEDKKKETTPCG